MPVNIDPNIWQNKFEDEGHISKMWPLAKIAILWAMALIYVVYHYSRAKRASAGGKWWYTTYIKLWPKNASATLVRALRMVITWPLFIQFSSNKKLSSISLLDIFVVGPIFAPRPRIWAILYLWTQKYPQIVGTCPGHHGQLISRNCVLKNRFDQIPKILYRDAKEMIIYQIVLGA